jgi:hypothetical protein
MGGDLVYSGSTSAVVRLQKGGNGKCLNRKVHVPDSYHGITKSVTLNVELCRYMPRITCIKSGSSLSQTVSRSNVNACMLTTRVIHHYYSRRTQIPRYFSVIHSSLLNSTSQNVINPCASLHEETIQARELLINAHRKVHSHPRVETLKPNNAHSPSAAGRSPYPTLKLYLP